MTKTNLKVSIPLAGEFCLRFSFEMVFTCYLDHLILWYIEFCSPENLWSYVWCIADLPFKPNYRVFSHLIKIYQKCQRLHQGILQQQKTRMHSSRMRTACSLPYGGGLCLKRSPRPRPPGQRSPDRDPSGQRPSRQRPPWTETPWTETPRLRPPWTETPWTETLPPLDRDPMDRDPPGQRPPMNRMTHRCKNITLPQLRYGR